MGTHTGGNGSERRRHPRLNIALDVAFGPVGSTKATAEASSLERTVTVNISLSGMCLYTDVLYPVGTSLYCAMTIPGRSSPLEFVGTVAWFQKVSQEPHGYKLGVEFGKLTAKDRAVLERLIREPLISSRQSSKKLLLVDDDVELAQAIKVRLESAGFAVLTATEGLEALNLCRAERPHLVILDLMLPKLNGYEVCRLLKFDQKFHQIPIIVLTARSRQEDKELCYAMGADAYITKPFNGVNLLAKVDELLAKSPQG